MSYCMNGWCKEIPGGDTISRAAALDALDEIESEVADGEGFQYEKWRSYIAELPAAQPELIRCKNCKNNQLPSTSGNANCEIYYGMTDQDGFCHMAERRTDDI